MKTLIGLRTVIRPRRVFIVIDSIRQPDKLAIAELYAQVYGAPPWDEEWTLESALAEFEEVSGGASMISG